jgi:hypothetical protein
MSQADKQVQLDRFIGQLPSHVAERLAKALEVDRMTGGSDLPHAELLQALRPQLRETAKPPRPPNPQRSFCRPFEDLLVNTVPVAKQKGRISRVSIGPVWNWLANDLIPDQHKALCEALHGALVAGEHAQVQQTLADLWRAASAAIRSALGTPERKATAIRRLGSAVIADDAAEMALLVSAGTDLVRLLEDLPRPIKTLGQHEIAILRNAYDHMNKTQPDLAPYIAVIAMSRLERPSEALHLAGIFAHASDDAMISNTDVGIVGDILFSDLDHYAEIILAARPPQFDPDTLLPALASFAELSAGMVKELGIRRDGKWGQHLTRSRAAISEAMEALLVRAPKEINAALPSARPGAYGKGPKTLDLSRPPDAERVAKALRYARIIGQARPYAAAAAFHAKLTDIRQEIGGGLRSTVEELLRDLRAPSPGAHAGEHVAAVLDLCTFILGEEETDLYRRRARATARP